MTAAPTAMASPKPAKTEAADDDDDDEEDPQAKPIPEAKEKHPDASKKEPVTSKKEESKVSVGAEADQNARYLWRGLALSRGPVFQPSAWGSLYGLTADVWTNVMLFPGESARESLSTVIPELGYELSWKHFKFEPAAVLYWERGEERLATTAEASLKITYDLGWVGLATAQNFDVLAHPGAYFGTAGPQLKGTFGSATLKAMADVGWASASFNRAYLTTDAAAVNVVEGHVEFRNDVNSVIYYVIHGEASALLAHTPRREGNDPVLFNVGFTLGTELSL